MFKCVNGSDANVELMTKSRHLSVTLSGSEINLLAAAAVLNLMLMLTSWIKNKLKLRANTPVIS